MYVSFCNPGVEFVNDDAGLALYFQPGDDTEYFLNEVEQYTRAFGAEYALPRLWEIYSEWFGI